MRKVLSIAACVSTLMAAIALPAWGQERAPCAPFDQLKANLAAEHQETVVAQGPTADGNMLMRFESKNGATYSMVLVSPKQYACIMEFGMDWQERHDAPAVPEEGL